MTNITRRDLIGGATNAVVAIETTKLAAISRQGLTPAAAATAAPSPDGLPPGLYFPSELWVSPNLGAYNAIGSGFARGLAGPQTWTITGPDVAGFSLSGANGSTLVFGIALYGSTAKSSYSLTINVTDGVTKFSQAIVIHNDATALINAANYLLDSAPVNYYGNDNDHNSAPFGGLGSCKVVGPTSGPLTLNEPSNTIRYNFGSGIVVTTDAAQPLSQHYGAYTATFTFPDGNGATLTRKVPLWIAAEANPVAAFTGAPVYDNAMPGDVFGQLHAFSDAGISSITLTQNPHNALAVGVSGKVTVAAAMVAGVTQTAVFRITSTTGKTTDFPVTFTVQKGTTLPASNMTPSFSAKLDNSMTNGAVGSIHVAGMTSPTWLPIALVNDDSQFMGAIAGYPIIPRYTMTPRADSTTADVHFAALSAQTDQLVFTAREGGTLCTATIPLRIAAKAGPTKTVGPAGGHWDFPSVNVAQDAWWTNTAVYVGGTLVLHPQDYSQQFSRTQLGHGSAQMWFPGPATMQGLAPNNRTLLDFKGNAPYGTKAGIGAVNFDLTLRNLEIANVTNVNAGQGNAGAVGKENGTWGNVGLYDCFIHNSDMGWHAGERSTHLHFERVIFAECGAGAGGLTHNIYADGGNLTLIDVLSFATAQVYALKTRCRRGTVTRGFFIGGENGAPGASAAVDIPNGGDYTFTDTVMMNSPNPNNSGSVLLYCEEAGGGNGTAWPSNTLVIDGCKIINVVPQGSTTYPIIGIDLRNDNHGAFSPVSGKPAQIIVKNTGFYNLSRANWWRSATGAANIIDGGGNYALTEWVDCAPIDPSTKALMTTAPNPSYSKWVGSYECAMLPPLTTQLRVAAGCPVGTYVTTLTGYDNTGTELTAKTVTLTNTAGGRFAVDPSTGVITTAGPIADGLYFIAAQVSGTNSSGATVTYAGYNGQPKNIFVVGGTGAVPAIA